MPQDGYSTYDESLGFNARNSLRRVGRSVNYSYPLLTTLTLQAPVGSTR